MFSGSWLEWTLSIALDFIFKAPHPEANAQRSMNLMTGGQCQCKNTSKHTW